MSQTQIKSGSRVVVVTEDCGRVDARLYVDHGNVATLTCWKGKTAAGAQKWATKVLAANQCEMS